MKKYTRKKLSEELSINPETLRYYEKINLIKKPKRNESDYRIYDERDRLILLFIIKSKEFGFSLKEIKSFVEIINSEKLIDINISDIIESKLKCIDNEINALVRKKEELINFCSNFENSSCSITKELLKKNNLTY